MFVGIVTELSFVIKPISAQDSRNINSKIIYNSLTISSVMEQKMYWD